MQLWRLAWPIMLSTLSVPLVGAVDTAVIGHTGNASMIGGVALGSVIFSVIYWIFSFLRMGTTGFVAQAFGRGDMDGVAVAVARAGILAIMLGLTLILGGSALLGLCLNFLSGSNIAEGLAAQYFHIRIWSAPAALTNYAVLGILIGMGRTGTALLIQLCLNLSNVALDLLLVSVAGLGIEGVAVASVISEVTAAVAGIAVVVRSLATHLRSIHWRMLLQRSALAQTMAVNLNIAVRTAGVIVAHFWFMSRSAAQGDIILAANSVLLHFSHIAAYGLDGFAHATEIVIGQAYGRRDHRAYSSWLKVAMLCSLITASIYCIVFALAGKFLIATMTNVPEVRNVAAIYLPWLIALPVIAVWSYLLDGVYIGCTQSVEMRNGMLIALVGFVISVHVLMPRFANHGLWAAMLVLLALRGVTLGLWLPRIVATITPRTVNS